MSEEKNIEDTEEIIVNYETLYDILRKEKNTEDLQPLGKNFFHNVIEYLNNKKALIIDSKNKQDLFSTTEKTETKTQIENIRRMISGLYERREKKLIMMALNKSRTNSELIDTSNLFEEEKQFFNNLVEVLNWFRNGVIHKLLNCEPPKLEERKSETKSSSESNDESDDQENTECKDIILVRFLKPVPKFVGKELEIYGPFEEEDVANLPKEIANVLINKGRAESMDD